MRRARYGWQCRASQEADDFDKEIGGALLRLHRLLADRRDAGRRPVIEIAGNHRFRQAHALRQQRGAFRALALRQRVRTAENIQHRLDEVAVGFRVAAGRRRRSRSGAARCRRSVPAHCPVAARRSSRDPRSPGRQRSPVERRRGRRRASARPAECPEIPCQPVAARAAAGCASWSLLQRHLTAFQIGHRFDLAVGGHQNHFRFRLGGSAPT